MSLSDLFSNKPVKKGSPEKQAVSALESLKQDLLIANTSSSTPYTITTTSPNGTALTGQYTLGVDPASYGWVTGTTTTGISYGDTAEFKKLKCKLPEGALEKLMTIGLIKSKKVLKHKIEEAFTNWCNTQTLDVSVFPMLLAACVLILKDENETISKEEK